MVEVIACSIMAHRYGLENYSILIFVLSVTGVLRVVGSLGFEQNTQGGEKDKPTESIMLWQGIWLIALYVLYLGVVSLWMPNQYSLFLLAGVFQFLSAILYQSFKMAARQGRFDLEKNASIISGVVLLGLTLVFSTLNFQIERMVFAYILSSLSGVVFLFISGRSSIMPRVIWSLDRLSFAEFIYRLIEAGWRKIFRSLEIFFLYLVVVGLLLGHRNIGLFQASFGLCILILIVFQFFLSQFVYTHSLEEWQQNCGSNVLSIGITGLMMSVVIFVLAPYIIQCLYGRQFLEAVKLLRMAVLALPILLINEYFLTLCSTGECEVEIRRIGSVGILFLIVAGLYWIPRYQVAGAIWAFFVSESIMLVLYYIDLGERWKVEHSQTVEILR